MAYPHKVIERLGKLKTTRISFQADGQSAAANFECGSAIRFHISVDHEARKVGHATSHSNGCGFMLAAADVLAEAVAGKLLSELKGLSPDGFLTSVEASLGTLPDERIGCVNACVEALRGAFADHRMRQVEEFRGEKALICTCFAVSEETIAETIAKHGLTTVDDVTNACGAGGGCGSCTILIGEMLAGAGIDR